MGNPETQCDTGRCELCGADRRQYKAEAERLRKAMMEAVRLIHRNASRELAVPEAMIEAAELLQAALTPPTAASGEQSTQGNCDEQQKAAEATRGAASQEKAISQEATQVGAAVAGDAALEPAAPVDCVERFIAPSAPAAESEGGNRRRHYFNTGSTVLFGTVDDCRQECVCESREDAGKLADALNEHSALSARLAACEERCKELEAGIEKHQRQHQAIYEELDGAEKFDRELWSLLAPKAEGGRDG